MLDRSFLEKLEEMATPAVVETVEGTFTPKSLSRVMAKTADNLTLTTLTGLAAMIKHEKSLYNKPLYVRITDPARVDVFGTIRDDNQRENPYAVRAELPDFDFGHYYSIEYMIIALRSMFEPTEDRDYLVTLLGNITDNESVSTKDDGITQTATVRSGIALMGTSEIKPIVRLKPYRAFLEVEQPESEFLIRLKNGQAALFEADGGRWRNEAIANIGDLLRELFKNDTDVIVIE